jgi:hypothetical protein
MRVKFYPEVPAQLEQVTPSVQVKHAAEKHG